MPRLPVLLVLLLAALVADGAEAQIFDRIRDRVRDTVEREVEARSESAAERAVEALFEAGEDAVRCLFTDAECIRRATEAGDDVVLTDAEGTPVDATGAPVSEANPEAAVVRADAAAGVSGVDANYDFEPGERVLFEEDFARDHVGDFPRRLEFRSGSMEVVETASGRALQGKTDGAFDVALPETLPERFTLEFDFQATDFVNDIRVYAVDAEGERVGTSFVQVDPYGGVGVGSFERGGVESVQPDRRLDDQLLPIRVMADGAYLKVFVGQERVANIPNADFGRTGRLRFDLHDVRDQPVYLANLRVAAGGRDLYGALEAEGRVVTEGVLFDTGSATLQPASFAVVQEIAAMLEAHPELRVRIEGHTDDQGDAAANQALSERRARAVQTMLIGLGVAADRLEAAGLGPTQPVASNDTAEGRAQNRRVELVRL